MTADPQVISNIYARLQNGFCPAVRQVAQTGTNLLALQSAYFKAFDAHLAGLQELAKSGSDVCEDSNRFSSELGGICSALQQINREEEKLFISFANLMAAVSKFSESEKDRIKDMSIKYQKDEKTINKNFKKTGDNAPVQNFYSVELKKAKEQHSQRYAYFSKNYLELLRKQSTISKRNVEISEKQVLEADSADAVKRLDEIVTSNDTVKSGVTENLLIRDEANELYEQPLTTANQPQGLQRTSVKSAKAENRSRRNTEDPVKVITNIHTEEITQVESRPESRPHTAASRMSSASGLEIDNRSLNTDSRGRSPAALPRKVLSPNIYKATPILGMVQAEMEEQERQNNNEIAKIPRATSNGEKWKDYDTENNNKERDYFDEIPRPNYIPDHKIYEPPKQQPIVVKQPYRPSQPPPNLPQIAPRNEENRPPPRYVKPEAKPQPTFAVSDYGRSLACTQSYTGQGEHQLSLNSGEHVKLVKSGTRGWALVKSSDSRQGWFPTKFLELL